MLHRIFLEQKYQYRDTLAENHMSRWMLGGKLSIVSPQGYNLVYKCSQNNSNQVNLKSVIHIHIKSRCFHSKTNLQ